MDHTTSPAEIFTESELYRMYGDDIIARQPEQGRIRAYVLTDGSGNVLASVPANARIVRRDDGFYDIV